MRKKHLILSVSVILILLVCNFGGVFAFLNHWAFDRLVNLGPNKPISSEIVAIRVHADDDIDQLLATVQDLECQSLLLLMLNQSGTLTSYVMSADGGLQFTSDVRPPDSLTWRGPQDVEQLELKLKPIVKRPVELGRNVWLDFAQRDEEFSHMEANQVITGDFEEGFFKDKIVIVGDHFSSQTRFYSTPVHKGQVALTALSKEMLLVDNALRASWVSHVPRGLPVSFAVLIVIAYLGAYLRSPFLRFKRLTAGMFVVFAGTSILMLKIGHIWLPPTECLFAILAMGIILYLRSYHEIQKTLSNVLRQVIAKPTCGVFVYGVNKELKYYSDDSETFLERQFGIDLLGCKLNQFLAKMIDKPVSEIVEIVEKASDQRMEFDIEPKEDQIGYKISVGPLNRYVEHSDLIVSIKECCEEGGAQSSASPSTHTVEHAGIWSFLAKHYTTSNAEAESTQAR